MKKNLMRAIFWGHRGFTLIELMIIVMILAILTSFAMPLYINYKAGAMQSEARIFLEGIILGETAHYADKSEFSVDEKVIGFSPTDPKFYKNWDIWVFPAATREHFAVTCSANLDNDIFFDTWSLDDDPMEPVHTFNDVRDM